MGPGWAAASIGRGGPGSATTRELSRPRLPCGTPAAEGHFSHSSLRFSYWR